MACYEVDMQHNQGFEQNNTNNTRKVIYVRLL